MSSSNPTNADLNLKIELMSQELHQHVNMANTSTAKIEQALDKNTQAIEALLQEFRDMKNDSLNTKQTIKDFREDYGVFKAKVWPIVNNLDFLKWGLGAVGLTGLAAALNWLINLKK